MNRPHRRGFRDRGRRRLVHSPPHASSATIAIRRITSRSSTSSTSGSIPAPPMSSCWKAAPGACPGRPILYLEGSDQHRGWFHSSLLESCGTRGRAPYDAVLTHGFVLDEKGRKMSKSLGNTVAPQDVVSAIGADILRLWVARARIIPRTCASVPRILKTQVDVYRRLRNTLRYLLGALDGFAKPKRCLSARCRSSSAGCCIGSGSSTVRCVSACDDFQFHVDVHRTAQFLRRRSLGLLFRHPQGLALLRPADRSAPPRRAHGDGRRLRPA